MDSICCAALVGKEGQWMGWDGMSCLAGMNGLAGTNGWAEIHFNSNE